MKFRHDLYLSPLTAKRPEQRKEPSAVTVELDQVEVATLLKQSNCDKHWKQQGIESRSSHARDWKILRREYVYAVTART